MAQPAEIFNAAWDAADEPIPTATTPSLLSFHWVAAALCLPNEVNEINVHRWMQSHTRGHKSLDQAC